MADDEATKRVLALRQRLDAAKTKLTEARTEARAAEDALAAADDAIRDLGLDPDHDLERQIDRLIADAEADLEKVEECLGEVESVLGR